jgi:outer membrane protein assembly factor BamB
LVIVPARIGHGPDCPFPGVVVAGGGVTALRISDGAQPAIKTAWRANLHGLGAPIVTTSDARADPIVWIVGAEGDQKLHCFRGDTGQEVFTGAELDGLRHYVTILSFAGRLYLAGDSHVFAFAPAPRGREVGIKFVFLRRSSMVSQVDSELSIVR